MASPARQDMGYINLLCGETTANMFIVFGNERAKAVIQISPDLYLTAKQVSFPRIG